MSHTIKCHKCGKSHKSHTATELGYLDGKYYWTKERPLGSVLVCVGNTCYEKIWREFLKK